MIDHTGITISDFEKSKKWYVSALSAIGYAKLMEFSKEITGEQDVAGFGEIKTKKPDFWIATSTKDKPVGTPKHIAFRAKGREEVNAFYDAAIKAGGKDNGKPVPRPHYHDEYYGAFVLDPDGNNIEAVYHGSKA